LFTTPVIYLAFESLSERRLSRRSRTVPAPHEATEPAE